ncbi:calcium-transporting P-type ATPase, PMR1-type [Methanosarcina mazei]|jgi:Ca2+-transporting ATPase|uniref:P-type Ca(2+) transporter n=2 Tax=Methanosarcina mazei TaxID=2209 RepID=A0A0F8PYR4_METMZ|nr:calcium-transporting P-type ATPase, PMR1-type [Methanosarcina mazei]AKB69483.1 Cation-transporting ATPase, E1-E2 family [Methanosarcina mazei LYC]KKH67813.1 ATPase [Methanosarcina mazei]UWJ23605.1 Cation-transporting ATPase, E1-E2 family [Methanosarcina mazei TMA]BBL64352.1 calcium-translocating P-type ATPase, SERCA-type [Methanosarcina mazei]
MYHDEAADAVLKTLDTSETGLSSGEAENRLKKYGKNELKEEEKTSAVKLFLSQFKSFLILILIVAALVSAFLGELVDALVILFTVFLAGVLGFVQEYRAEESIKLLKSLTSPEALVVRNGKEVKVLSSLLVPGDILILQAGDRIPADARLLEAQSLKIDESSLTGESVPVEKSIKILLPETPQPDRKNMAYTGTSVTYGRGKAVITATGMSTAFGKLAGLLGEIERERTPLQEKLDQFGRWLGAATLIVVAFVAVLGIFKGFDPFEMFLWGVALAVAAIPEALPAVVTVGLALGVRRMVKRHALVRKLPSVETLGSTNIICTDKTGTLTQNKMTVEKVYVNRTMLSVTGNGYEPVGDFFKDGQPVSEDIHLHKLLVTGALCNDAGLVEEEGIGDIIGDPTEGALVVAAAKKGIWRPDLELGHRRIGEVPFSSERKMMTTLNASEEGLYAYSKGAPEVILGCCTKIFHGGQEKELTPEIRKEILDTVNEMANQTLRVMGFAYRQVPENIVPENAEREMVFAGLMGMRDPPREEVKVAIATCTDAGIRTVMITGDHKTTAFAIAREIGIYREGDLVLTGTELDALGDKEFEDMVEKVSVYARVYPEHKLKVVNALKKKGYIVAMTGDGVNDAPALKAADMGIAMGITGTEVSKEASSMILTDDNFASIVSAVEEGRNILKNIKNFIAYGLTCHIGVVLIVLVGVLAWQILPVIAVQILWINLITDGLPPMALSLEAPDRGLMKQKPRKSTEGLVSRRMLIASLGLGALIAVQSLGVLSWALEEGMPLPKIQTLIFTLVVISLMFNAFNWRSDRLSVFSLGIFTNRPLIYAVLSTVLLQLAAIYVPVLQTAFRTVPLSLSDWGMIIPLASTTLIVMEVAKYLERRAHR